MSIERDNLLDMWDDYLFNHLPAMFCRCDNCSFFNGTDCFAYGFLQPADVVINNLKCDFEISYSTYCDYSRLFELFLKFYINEKE